MQLSVPFNKEEVTRVFCVGLGLRGSSWPAALIHSLDIMKLFPLMLHIPVALSRAQPCQ